MAPNDDNSFPRFDTLHELITRSQNMGVTVQVSIHNVPVAVALEWVQLGLLDRIEQGAGGNPPTGTMEAGTRKNGLTQVNVFTDGPRLTKEQRDAAIERLAAELEANKALAAELARTDEEEQA